MTKSTTTETAAKKDVTKLQRAIVDGLEDVKAQDIQVFNTEKLSPLFERVIVASGTSNRQTKALASSVRDAVREAGFAKPRIEGEENGEWIIVDCGAAVVHVMQPAIRQYYRLEEIWGATPVRLKLGAPKPAVSDAAATKKAAKKTTKASAKAEGKAEPKTVSPAAAKKLAAQYGEAKAEGEKAAPKKAAAKKVAAKTTTKATSEDAAAAQPAAKSAAKKTAAKKAPATKTAAKTPAKTPVKTVVVNKPVAAKKPRAAAKKAPAKAPARKA